MFSLTHGAPHFGPSVTQFVGRALVFGCSPPLLSSLLCVAHKLVTVRPGLSSPCPCMLPLIKFFSQECFCLIGFGVYSASLVCVALCQ